MQDEVAAGSAVRAHGRRPGLRRLVPGPGGAHVLEERFGIRTVRWIAGEEGGSPDHGSGRTGTTRPGPVLTVASVVREGAEVRLARADGLAPGHRFRMGGRPIAGDARPRAEAAGSGRANELVRPVHPRHHIPAPREAGDDHAAEHTTA